LLLLIKTVAQKNTTDQINPFFSYTQQLFLTMYYIDYQIGQLTKPKKKKLQYWIGKQRQQRILKAPNF